MLSPTIPPPTPPFTVIILGSSPSALLLALSLTRAKISYTLLSRASTLPTPTSAHLTLHPHATAILDQLGIWSALSVHAAPLHGAWWARVHERLGYPFVVVSAQELTEALLAALHPAKVHTNVRVVDVRCDTAGARVITAAMEMFRGDVVVVADAEGWLPWPAPPGLRSWVSTSGAAAGAAAVTVHRAPLTTSVAGAGWWNVIAPAAAIECATIIPVEEKEMEECPTTTIPSSSSSSSTISRTIEIEEFVAPEWTVERTCLFGPAAYQLSPLLHLDASVTLEAVAALTNALCEFQSPNAFTVFEATHRPRVELCTKAIGGPRWIPVWVYEEFAVRGAVLKEPRLEGKFWERRRRGGVSGVVGRWWSGVGVWWSGVRIWAGALEYRTGMGAGVGVLGVGVGLLMCARWRVDRILGVGLKRALLTTGRKRW